MPPFDPAAYARESESKLRARAPVHEHVPDEDSGIQPVQERVEDVAFDEPFNHSPTRPSPIVLVAVPALAVSPAELSRLALDHRAGFILSHVDGMSDVETILDVSAMPTEEALNILSELATRGIITLR
jgi:hypothetical protein